MSPHSGLEDEWNRSRPDPARGGSKDFRTTIQDNRDAPLSQLNSTPICDTVPQRKSISWSMVYTEPALSVHHGIVGVMSDVLKKGMRSLATLSSPVGLSNR